MLTTASPCGCGWPRSPDAKRAHTGLVPSHVGACFAGVRGGGAHGSREARAPQDGLPLLGSPGAPPPRPAPLGSEGDSTPASSSRSPGGGAGGKGQALCPKPPPPTPPSVSSLRACDLPSPAGSRGLRTESKVAHTCSLHRPSCRRRDRGKVEASRSQAMTMALSRLGP